MKQYLIKNSDIMHNGKIFPEGSTINLDDKDAKSLSSFLEEIKDASVSSTTNISKNNKRNKLL